MSEYYTPELEEFHVGFICEMESVRTFNGIEDVHDAGLKKKDVREAKSKWNSHRYEISEWYEVEWCENMSFPCHTDYAYRVKYLDREDIESLGFEHTGRTIDDWYELKVSRPAVMSAHTNRRYVLMHDFRTNQGVVIMAYDYESGDSGENTIYRGSCKNKSELKKLLKQLGL